MPKLPKLGIVSGLKKAVGIAGSVNAFAQEAMAVKEVLLNHNSDKTALFVANAEEFDQRKAKGENVVFMPPPEEPDLVQLIAVLKYAGVLLKGLVQAVIDEVKDGDHEPNEAA